MAMTANDIIVITDVVNYINSYLKMSIQNKIEWYKEKLPPNFDSNLSHYFHQERHFQTCKHLHVKVAR